MTLWKFLKYTLEDLWFFPMMWPGAIGFELGGMSVEWHWSVTVLTLPFVVAFIVIGTMIMLPVQLFVFLAMLAAAPFALIIHLTKKVLAK